jgi:uncharacterized membrane protein YcaP (DUF421 family)
LFHNPFNPKKDGGIKLSSILEIMLRSSLAFFALLLFVRLMGKQQMSQLTFFDYVTGITIGSIAANLSVQLKDPFWDVLVGMTMWTVLAIILAQLCMKSIWLRKIVDGEPTIVISNGKILENNLKRIRIPLEGLLSELRAQEIFHIEDVEFALLEPSGKLSVQKKTQNQTITAKDLHMTTVYDGLPTNLVLDGVVLKDALQSLHLSHSWLVAQLQKQNLTDFTQISLAQLDTQGNLYVDVKKDDAYFCILTKE